MSSPIKLLTQYSILYLPQVDDGKSATDHGHLPIQFAVCRIERYGEMSSEVCAGANLNGSSSNLE